MFLDLPLLSALSQNEPSNLSLVNYRLRQLLCGSIVLRERGGALTFEGYTNLFTFQAIYKNL